MRDNQTSDVAELRAEVTRLRQALWDVLVAVDELAYVVEFSREQEVGTRPTVEAIERARDLLKQDGVAHPPIKTRMTAP